MTKREIIERMAYILLVVLLLMPFLGISLGFYMLLESEVYTQNRLERATCKEVTNND